MSETQRPSIKQIISRAKKAAEAGDTAVARDLYNAVLARHPNHPAAKKALHRLERGSSPARAPTQSAKDQTDRKQTPDPPRERIDVLLELHRAGRLAELARGCETLLQTWPRSWFLCNLLGMARKGEGKSAEAAQAFERAIRIKPDSIDAWNNRGVVLQELGEPEAALESYDKVIGLKPDLVEVHFNRGIVLRKLERPEEAVASYDEAIRIDPDYVDAWHNRGIALQQLERSEEALSSFDRVIRLQPGRADVYSGRSKALADLGRLEEAIADCDEAIRLDPNHADAYSSRGNALKILGRLQEAEESCEQAIRLDPSHPGAYANLGAVRKYQPGDPRIGSMARLLENPELLGQERTLLCFALAKACEDVGEYDKGFDYLFEGNRLRKEALDYTPEGDRRVMARVKEIFAAQPPVPDGPSSGEKDSIRPIFIVGMPRSGTSLAEQILASHSRVHGAGELETVTQLVTRIPPAPETGPGWRGLPPPAVDIVREGYLEALAALHVPEKVITDKMPLNFRWIGFILSAFPEARIIHTNRDPMAICWSNYKINFKGKGIGYAYDMADLAEFYRRYVDLMAFWRERYPNYLYELSYEALTENQEEETRKLLAFCDLDWEERCLDFHKTKRPVKTASAAQVRQQMYKGSSEAWRHYEKHLQPLLTALETPLPPEEAATSARPAAARQCWPCTGCCDGWVQMQIKGAPVYPGHPCPHSTGEGCNDYENRPTDPCRDFDCAWIIQESPLPDWMRPDLGKVIVLFGKFDWNEHPVDLAVPVGEKIPARSLAWLEEFSRKLKRPLVYTEQVMKEGKFQRQQQVFGYGPPAFQQDLLRWQREGKKLW